MRSLELCTVSICLLTLRDDIKGFSGVWEAAEKQMPKMHASRRASRLCNWQKSIRLEAFRMSKKKKISSSK